MRILVIDVGGTHVKVLATARFGDRPRLSVDSRDHVLEPVELAHLPYKKGRSYEDHAGLAGLERLGKKKWRRQVREVVQQLRSAVQADYVVVGGGNEPSPNAVAFGAPGIDAKRLLPSVSKVNTPWQTTQAQPSVSAAIKSKTKKEKEPR
jgi:hypothetical protein